MIVDDEIQSLFKKVKTKLGWPVRKVQLTDEQLCTMLEMCIEDYTKEVQNWIIESQWSSLYAKNLSTIDLTFALVTRTFDMARDYGNWFVKFNGLQQNGPWELKKDFFTIEEGKQDYVIPAGRELCKVLWATPSSMNAALYSNMNGGNYALAGVGGLSQFGAGIGSSMMNGSFIFTAYDSLALSADIDLKSKMIRGDVTYYVTSLATGERVIHLTPVPGYKNASGSHGAAKWSLYGLLGQHVWYTYYDLSQGGDKMECWKANSDIIMTPDQVPLKNLEWFMLNDPAKTLIRQLLVADAKLVLGQIRGYASGKISIPEAEMQLDYQMLLEQGKQEREDTIKELRERLERMSPVKQAEINASITDNTIKTLRGTPLGLYAK